MSGLTGAERERLVRAGFTPERVAGLDVLARRTPWLAQARWTVRRETVLSLVAILPMIAAGPLFYERPSLWALIVLACSAHYWSLGLRRAASRIKEPALSGDRTLIALAVRADPEDMSGRGAAFARLKARADA